MKTLIALNVAFYLARLAFLAWLLRELLRERRLLSDLYADHLHLATFVHQHMEYPAEGTGPKPDESFKEYTNRIRQSGRIKTG